VIQLLTPSIQQHCKGAYWINVKENIRTYSFKDKRTNASEFNTMEVQRIHGILLAILLN